MIGCMKWFYLISLLCVATLTLSPLVLLPSGRGADLRGLVVAYNTYGAKIKSLDPATCGDNVSATFQGYVFESLYAYDWLARPLKVVPQLAEDMPEVSGDLLTYTFRLRKGVKYRRNPCFGLQANDTPRTRTVRAEDFVLAFKRIADYHINAELSLAFVEERIAGLHDYRQKTRTYDKGDFSRYDLPVEGLRALDEHTFQIRLAAPFPQLLYVLAINVYAPVPREMVDYWLATRDDGRGGRQPLPIKQRDPEIRDFRATVGTGAYYFQKFVDGGDIIVRRNEDYREAYYPQPPDLAKLDEVSRRNAEEDIAAGFYQDAGKRVPFIDAEVSTYVPETNPMWMLFLSKQTDAAAIPREVYEQVISPSQELTDQWAGMGIRLYKYSDPTIYWLVFNNQDPVLGASRSLRQALCLAYNVEDFIRVLRNGRAIRAVNTVPSGFEAHDEAGDSPYARFDLQAARAKLQDARKELTDAGVIPPGGDIPPLTLYLGDTGEEGRKQGEFAQGQFRQIGVQLNVELVDWPTLQEKVQNKQCQLYAMGWGADYPDPENFLQLYYGPNIARGTNNCNYSNPRFDRLYAQAAVMLPSPQRTALCVQMIRLLNEDCPVLLETEPIRMVLVHDWIKNVKPHPIGYGFFKYRRIDADLRRKLGGRS